MSVIWMMNGEKVDRQSPYKKHGGTNLSTRSAATSQNVGRFFSRLKIFLAVRARWHAKLLVGRIVKPRAPRRRNFAETCVLGSLHTIVQHVLLRYLLAH